MKKIRKRIKTLAQKGRKENQEKEKDKRKGRKIGKKEDIKGKKRMLA